MNRQHAFLGPLRILERNLLVTKRHWLPIFAGVFEPIFYLFSIGIGLGALVGDVPRADGTSVPYAIFVAPALLASSAMNGAIYESTFNVFFRFKYGRIYDAMLSTPITPWDIALGEISWSLIRGTLYAIGFVAVMIATGLVHSAWGLLAIPATLFIGFAFGAVGMAATTFMKSWQHFDLIQLVQLPMFLFSATFYPLEVYPPWLQLVTQFSPLYHAVELIRSLTLGTPSWSILTNLVVLCAMGAVGLIIVGRRLGKLLCR